MEIGLEHVIGKPGSGKTSYVVHKVVTEDMDSFNWRYQAAVEYIKDFNRRRGTNLSLPPERHVVSSNIEIHRTHPTMYHYPINGFEFGAPNKWQPTKRLIPFGVYVFDEAQQYWDSKGVTNLPPWVNRVFELRRHISLKIYLMTQKLKRLHSDIRSTVDIFTIIKKSVHTYHIDGKIVKTREFLNKGKLVKTMFYGVHFDEEYQVEQYLAGDHSIGEPFKEEHFGDIRECYDHHEYAVELEDYDKDFNYIDYNEPEMRCQVPESWKAYKKTSENKNQKQEVKNGN